MAGGGEELLRLAAVVERQRRELASARAAEDAAEVVAMATGVLMERHGLSSPVEAARQLADMAAAAGMPLSELAAVLLSREPPPGPERAEVTLGEPLRPAARDTDGGELVRALAAQLRPRFGVAAVAVWLLEADGALEMLAEDGLGGTDASRWRRLPPQFDCPEQRVVDTLVSLWWETGPPPGDPVPAAAPWGRDAARAVVPLRHRSGSLLGVVTAWWRSARGPFDEDVRDALSAALAGFAEVLSVRIAAGPLGSVLPSPPILTALVEVAGSAMFARPLRGPAGTVEDFAIVYLSPGYADPAGRPAAELTGLTLLAAYPKAMADDGLFARGLRVLTTGQPEHAPGLVTASLGGGPDVTVIADLHVVPFFAGVLFTWRSPSEGERHAELLDNSQRLGSIGGWEEQLGNGTTRWTAAAFALFGLDPEQAAPIPIAQLHSFVIAADRGAVRRFQESLLRRREPAMASFRIFRPADSALRQLRVFAEPVVAGETLIAVRGAFQDVSPQYHTQVALAATRDQLADSEQRAAEEHQLAVRLQRAIMPPDEPPVESAGVEVAVRYRPAETGHLVGGDWYDTLLLPDNDLLLVVGDITGHGIDAVTGMVAARNALRGLAATGAEPADLLRHLNYAACHLAEGIAGTVICGRYNPQSRALRWARAGHLPPILVRGNDAEALPLPDGVLLGLDPEADYQEAMTQLRTGDTLLLFTDGLIERRTGSISDALHDLTAVAAPAGEDLASYLTSILTSAISDTGDDACLVAVRIL